MNETAHTAFAEKIVPELVDTMTKRMDALGLEMNSRIEDIRRDVRAHGIENCPLVKSAILKGLTGIKDEEDK